MIAAVGLIQPSGDGLAAKARIESAGKAFNRKPLLLPRPLTMPKYIISEAGKEQIKQAKERQAIAPKRNITAEKILKEISAKTNIRVDDIIGPSRKRKIVMARHEFCYRAYYETNLSYPAIGRIIHRDHTTIISSAKRWCNHIGEEYQYQYLTDYNRKKRKEIDMEIRRFAKLYAEKVNMDEIMETLGLSLAMYSKRLSEVRTRGLLNNAERN